MGSNSSKSNTNTNAALSSEEVGPTDLVGLKASRTELGEPIIVTNIETGMKYETLSIDESSDSILKIRTPEFRASAMVKVPPITHNEVWEIGWIQACTFLRFINSYASEGISSWEVPELSCRLRGMISDSDGENYPWYRNDPSCVLLASGPQVTHVSTPLFTSTFFSLQVTWDSPGDISSNRSEMKTQPNSQSRRGYIQDRNITLTSVRRRQEFLTWLVAKNAQTDELSILKTIQWILDFHVDIDPYEPLGSRVKNVSCLRSVPRILEVNVPFEHGVLEPPSMDRAQTMFWKPNSGETSIIIPPRMRFPKLPSSRLVKFTLPQAGESQQQHLHT